jgi:hypothetical protein
MQNNTHGKTRMLVVVTLTSVQWAGAQGPANLIPTTLEAGSGAVSSSPFKTGEPYELAGKRLLFTNWFFVRPGGFAWLDEQGNNVSVRGSQGPWEARFTRYDHPLGIRLVAQPAQRVGPVSLGDDMPASAKVAIITIIQEGNTYRAWGLCSGIEPSGFCCLESTDGMNWKRVDLELTEAEREQANRLNLGEGTVFRVPSAPPAGRYKLVTLGHMSYEEFEAYKKRRPDAWGPRAKREDVGHVFFVQGAVSPDGLRWTMLDEPLVVEHSDTQIVGCFDERLQKYVIYTRNWMVGRKSSRAREGWGRDWWSVGRRSIGRTESSTFGRFPLSRLVLVPPMDWSPSDVLYTNGKTVIPGAPDHHVMFPTVWHTVDDTTSVVMAASHDNAVWSFVPGGELFTTPAFGEWDGGCVFARPNLIELPDGSFALPYTGYNVPHKYPRGQIKYQTGYMAWPKGRLVALEAEQRGEFATVAIMPPGQKLLVNTLTQRAGRILVEVADLGGRPLAGRSFADADPIQGDQFREPVTWKGEVDLGQFDGQPVILRFRMDRAKLFGLEFE